MVFTLLYQTVKRLLVICVIFYYVLLYELISENEFIRAILNEDGIHNDIVCVTE